MKKYIVILFVTVSLHSEAQTYVELQSGVASYGFGDLKAWQNDLVNFSDLNLSVVEAFPAYGTFQGNLLFPWGNGHFGGGLSYFSSGGRMGYWDDTGSIVEDQLIEKFGVHIIASYGIAQTNKLILEFRSTVVMNFTSLRLSSAFTIGQESTSQEAELSSFNPTYSPSLDLKYQIGKNFGLSFSIAGEIEFFRQQLLFKENRDVSLGLSDGSTAVKHGWTGFRALGGIYFSFSKK